MIPQSWNVRLASRPGHAARFEVYTIGDEGTTDRRKGGDGDDASVQLFRAGVDEATSIEMVRLALENPGKTIRCTGGADASISVLGRVLDGGGS